MAKTRTRKQNAERPGDDSGHEAIDKAIDALYAAQDALHSLGVKTWVLCLEEDPISDTDAIWSNCKGMGTINRRGMLDWAREQEGF